MNATKFPLIATKDKGSAPCESEVYVLKQRDVYSVVCAEDGKGRHEVMSNRLTDYRSNVDSVTFDVMPRCDILAAPNPIAGSFMPVKSWEECCRNGHLTNADGFGHLATALVVSNISVYPSLVTNNNLQLPVWATHIVWYNR